MKYILGSFVMLSLFLGVLGSFALQQRKLSLKSRTKKLKEKGFVVEIYKTIDVNPDPDLGGQGAWVLAGNLEQFSPSFVRLKNGSTIVNLSDLQIEKDYMLSDDNQIILL
jgi:hypothetical protein